jgi:hypothetical protein
MILGRPLRTPSGEKARSDLEYLGVVKTYLEKLFQKPPYRLEVLDALDARPELAHLDQRSTPTEVRTTAVRKLRHSAGGGCTAYVQNT